LAKHLVFSAYDAKIKTFNLPFYQQHVGQAMRMWQDATNNSETTVSRHPSDFVLYQIATFDDETGLTEVCNPHVRIASALEVKTQPDGELPLAPKRRTRPQSVNQ